MDGDVAERDGCDREGHEDRGKWNGGEVGGESHGGGAMEVEGHGEGESGLHERGDEQEFEGGECGAGSEGEGGESEASGGKVCEAGGEEAEIEAELRDAGRKFCVVGDGIEGAESAEIGLRSALENGNTDGGDDQDGEECELETWVEEGARVDEEESESGDADGVEHAALAIEKARGQVEGEHEGGAPDGGSGVGEEGVGDGYEHRDEADCRFAERGATEEPENYDYKDAEVHPGNDEDVIGARALKVDASVVVDEGVFADDHGVDECGVVRRPEAVDMFDHAGVDAGAKEFEAGARESGKNFCGIRA